jgi:NADP-dependent 3-hydroxy acid dehydrogenase YdfG
MRTMTLEKGLATFLDALAGKNRSAATVRAYQTDIAQFIAFLHANNVSIQTPADVEKVDVVEYLRPGLEIVRRYTEIPAEDVEQIIQVNLLGAMHLTHLVLPHMLERRRGHIVNMSSMAGKAVRPFATPYTTSKYALIASGSGRRAVGATIPTAATALPVWSKTGAATPEAPGSSSSRV